MEQETESLTENLDPAKLQKFKQLRQQIQKREGIMRGFFKDPLNRDQFSFEAKVGAYTGYQFSTDRDVIKCEVEFCVREMDCYVAPTFINLENPTFWINSNNISNSAAAAAAGLN